MTISKLLPLLVLTACAVFPLPGVTAEPTGDALLRQMSAKIAAARSFSLSAEREMDPGLLPGVTATEKAKIELRVLRPGQLTARIASPAGTRRFVTDGRSLAFQDETMKTYATVPMPGSLDHLVARLDDRYGFTPPLAEFVLSDPDKNFRGEARTLTDLGLDKIPAGFLGLGSVECRRLALKGNVADAELWIAVSVSCRASSSRLFTARVRRGCE